MQGNARKCKGNVLEWVQSASEIQGNAVECHSNVWEWVQSPRGMQGNAEECQGNVWEWVQNAMGMQGNARKCTATFGSGCKVPVECRVMQGNAMGTWEWVQSAREMHGGVCKVQWKCRGTPGECMGVGAKHQRNTGECRVMRGERMEVGATVHCCMPLYITAYTIAHHCIYYHTLLHAITYH